MHPPPIENGKVNLADAIEYIAATVDPDEFRDQSARRGAINRVRSRVRDSYRKVDPTRAKSVNAEKFWGWARRKRKWEILKTVEELPPFYVDGKANLAGGSSLTASAFEVPDSFNTLLKRFEDCRVQLAKCQKDKKQMQSDLIKLEEHCRKKSKQRADGHRYGKKGGRGNTN